MSPRIAAASGARKQKNSRLALQSLLNESLYYTIKTFETFSQKEYDGLRFLAPCFNVISLHLVDTLAIILHKH
ncbi:hypothetical protein ACTXT7_005518 [Hymenolepis weldensis]